MTLFVFQEGLETSPEDSCLQLSSQGAKKTSPFPIVWGDGPAQVSYKGKEQCCSAVRWMHCCKQSLTQQGAAAAHRTDSITCSTSALLLVVSVSLCNACEVRTTPGKWWTFALTAFSASAGSNPDLQDCPSLQAPGELWRVMIHLCSVSAIHCYSLQRGKPSLLLTPLRVMNILYICEYYI